VKIQVQKAVIVLVVLDRCEAWSFSLQEEQRLRVFWNRTLKEKKCLKMEE
jgi:hypothetical protein